MGIYLLKFHRVELRSWIS